MTDSIVLRRKHPHAMCEDCPMNGPRFKYVPSAGPMDAVVAVIGEAPGIEEIIARRPFHGPSGQLMRKALTEAGIDATAEVFYTNAVACRPPENKMEGYEAATDMCRPRLVHELNKRDSLRLLLAAGKYGAETGMKLLHGERYKKKVTITRQRGELVRWGPEALVRKDMLLTVHPAYVLRVDTVFPDFLTDVKRAGMILAGTEPEHPLQKAPAYKIVRHVGELSKLLGQLPSDEWYSFDVETNNFAWYKTGARVKAEILALGIGISTELVIIVPRDVLEDEECPPVLNDFFARVKTCAHNGKFDQLFLHREGITAGLDFDTMLAHYTLRENPPHGLKELGMSLYNIPNYEDDLIGKYLPVDPKARDYAMVPADKLHLYLAWDCALTWQLHVDLEAQLKADGLYQWPFMEILMPASETLLEVEKNGMLVDKAFLATAINELKFGLQEKLSELRDMTGRPLFNPNSWQQFGAVLFDDLGFPEHRNKHYKPRSTAQGAIKKAGPEMEYHPIVQGVFRYRRLGKMLTTYAEPIMNWTDAEGRVHPSYKIHAAETGRLSAVDPPIQTLPRAGRDKYGDMIRGAMITPPGHVFVMGDYSQAEMRVWAVFSGDPFLLDVYRSGRDLHDEGALRLFGPGYTKEQRTWVKNFNFAYIYGGNEYSFAGQFNLPIEAAKAFVREYEAMMPVAREWRDRVFREAVERGYCTTPFGRRRRFPLVTAETLDEIRKASWNMPIQSTASDLNLLAAIEMHRRGWKVVLSMHDATGLEVPVESAERAAQELHDVMVSLGEKWVPGVPWVVDIDRKKDGSFPTRWSPKPDIDEIDTVKGPKPVPEIVELEDDGNDGPYVVTGAVAPVAAGAGV